MKLPDSFKRLFRNYNFQKIDTEKHDKMIIKTTLVLGTYSHMAPKACFPSCRYVGV
jgi:hypothetical protein